MQGEEIYFEWCFRLLGYMYVCIYVTFIYNRCLQIYILKNKQIALNIYKSIYIKRSSKTT